MGRPPFSVSRQWAGLIGTVAALLIPALPPARAAASPFVAETPEGLLGQLDLRGRETLSLRGFEPRRNGFRFSNQELTEAIQNNRDREAWIRSFTRSLPEMFGAQVCVGEDLGQGGNRCILTAAAQSWLASELDLMEQGMCDAIAATSLFLWQSDEQPTLPWWRTLFEQLIPFTSAQVSVRSDVLQAWVANQALLQGLDEVYLPTQRIRETTGPADILAEAINAFRGTADNPYTLGVYRRQGNQLVEGHSLLPYRVEAQGNGQYRLYVYDSNLPVGTGKETYVLFDTVENTWSYAPEGMVPYSGDSQSQNLDLTRLSWRRPSETPEPAEMSTTGRFVCPFCAVGGSQSVEIALAGEGKLGVERFDPLAQRYVAVGNDAERVPFKGGLDREVPSSYVIAGDSSDRPLKITLTGTGSTPDPQETVALQIIGPGYTTGLEAPPLAPGEQLILYAAVTTTGPALTFVAQEPTTIPKLSVHLEDDYTETPAETIGEILEDDVTRSRSTEYGRHVSYSFDIGSISLPAGRSAGLYVNRDLQRFYFADNDEAFQRYTLSVTGRTREVQSTKIETQETFPDGTFETTTRTETRTRRYEESLQVSGVDVDNQLAYFDYGDWAQIPSDDDFFGRQASIEVPIAYVPLPAPADTSGLLSLQPVSGNATTRVYRGNLIKSNYR